jgi:hypothetical protein
MVDSGNRGGRGGSEISRLLANCVRMRGDRERTDA